MKSNNKLKFRHKFIPVGTPTSSKYQISINANKVTITVNLLTALSKLNARFLD